METASIGIRGGLEVPLSDLHFQFCRASGPGGQYVNRTDSAVQLRFDTNASYISDDIRRRLAQQVPGLLTQDGILLIDAQSERSQGRNRELALSKFREILLKASRRPTPRKPTKPTRASKERRLKLKKKHSELKRRRASSED